VARLDSPDEILAAKRGGSDQFLPDSPAGRERAGPPTRGRSSPSRQPTRCASCGRNWNAA